MNEHDRAARLRDAAALIEDTIERAAPLPWLYHEEHGRDFTGEGWSIVGITDEQARPVAWTYGPGYEVDHSEPESNAALAIIMATAAPAIVESLRAAAEALDDGALADAPLIVAAESVASAVYGIYDDFEVEHVAADEGKVIRTIVVSGTLRRAPRD